MERTTTEMARKIEHSLREWGWDGEGEIAVNVPPELLRRITSSASREFFTVPTGEPGGVPSIKIGGIVFRS